MPDAPAPLAFPGRRIARLSLALLLAINFLNYIDRYILAACEPNVQRTFFGNADDPATLTKMGGLATWFLISYILASPLLGWLADRMNRWLLIGISVALWSLASGGSGLAVTFAMLVATRVFVGIGEAGYGPSAPTIIADLFPVRVRGLVMSCFYMAIPVGSAMGYVIGGRIAASHLGWRYAFYAVLPPGLLLAVLSFAMRDPRHGGNRDRAAQRSGQPTRADYLLLLRTPSYILNTLAIGAFTFAIGGISFWMPKYLSDARGVPAATASLYFGGITAGCGLLSTLAGGVAGDWLRGRVRGAYFVVSAVAIVIAAPFVLLMLRLPFAGPGMPTAWFALAAAVFLMFFNTGPSNTALVNVTHPRVRATAFALTILVLHLVGDMPAPPLLGWIAGGSNGQPHWDRAFHVVASAMVLAGMLWAIGAWFLDVDTERANVGETT